MTEIENNPMGADKDFKRNAIIKATLNNIHHTALGLTILFVAFAIIDFLSVYDSTRFISMGVAAVTAIIFLGLYFTFKKHRFSEQHILTITGGMALLVVVNILMHVYVENDLRETIMLVILIIASGYFLLSSGLYAGVLALTMAGWGGVVFLLGASGESVMDFGVGIVLGIFTSGMIHLSRRRMVFRYENLIRNEQLAKAELKAKEVRYRALFDQTGDAIFIANPNGDIQEVNPVATNMLGYSEAELLQMNLFDLVARENKAKSSKRLVAMLKGEKLDVNECRYVKKDGSKLSVEVDASALFNSDHNVVQVQNIVRDITERKMAAEEIHRQKQYFEALVRHIPVAIVTLNFDNQVIDCNPAFVDLFGYQLTEIEGQSLDEIIAPHDLAEATSATSSVQNGQIVHLTSQRTRKDGSLVDVEIFGVPVTVNGVREGLLAIYHNISTLEEARKAAEDAAKTKSEFLANMSHEIRTPLNAITGMASLLQATELNREQVDFVDTIRSSTDALLTIINDILDFSKIEAGKMMLEKQPFYLRDVVESSLDLTVTKAVERHVELAYLLHEGTPLRVIGDVTRLRQVLVNLLSNAIKFTSDGEVYVQVERVRNLKDFKQEIQFSVSDTGIGIAPERMDRLFKSFSQVDSSTTRKYGGTGLGLSISKQLVEMMGGRIWVESEIGKGSTFYFTVVLKVAPGTGQLEPLGEQPSLAGLRVLVVDDNATNRMIVSKHVEAWGMQATAVESGPAALALIRNEQRFDFAILDMMMPEMDGAELANEIRKSISYEEMPLIMLSSLGYQSIQDKSSEFAAFLHKPLKPSQLFDLLIAIQDDRPVQQKQIVHEQQFDENLAETHPLRILLAEDNVVNQKVAQGILGKMGYTADLASNGKEAVEALERQTYDVVLMDVQMPEMDGIEATEFIRANIAKESQPWIVAMTANALDGHREEYLAVGMDDYVSKPVNIKELVKALKRATPIGPLQVHDRS